MQKHLHHKQSIQQYNPTITKIIQPEVVAVWDLDQEPVDEVLRVEGNKKIA
jgi:hypothetical protein